MTTFILAALAISALTLALILRPLFRTRDSNSYERESQNIHFARQRLAEIDRQLSQASISSEEHEALKLEIENTLADDIDLDRAASASANTEGMRSNRSLILALIVILPLAGLLTYWQLGTPQIFDPARTQAPLNNQEVSELISLVEERLKAQPDDAQGWQILSRTHLATGQYAKAKAGFLKVIELQGESPEILIAVADAAALQAGGDLSGEPINYVQRALELDPNQAQGLWLAGLASAQQNQTEAAVGYWNRLLPLLANNPEQQRELSAIIQETLAGDGGMAALPSAPSLPSDKSGATTPQGLLVRVSVTDELLSDVSPDDLVYVFARAEKGPPAPLAVKQLRVSDLPANLELSDADAMMPQLKLSLFERVQVSARIAKSGNPVAQPGDLQSSTVASSNTNQDLINLEISTTVE